ncbi:MAG: type II secretion system F family protein [Candidatus Omnitrophica bacterium]|nr:type II secretion system F family protein [Candidatus Omnitrophota bacterium]
MRFIILILTFFSIVLFFFVGFYLIQKTLKDWQKQRTAKITPKLENMFLSAPPAKKLLLFDILSIFGLGILVFFLTKNFLFALVGGFFGLSLPFLVIKRMEKARCKKFSQQLVDALGLLSGSLKAGLSLLQAFEVLVEEMPPPLSEEFGLIVKENKIGKALEESFEDLNQKMNSDDLNLMTTAILVARETGGNLTDVFSNLATTIRQKRRIVEQVKTLTTQARLQGIIMTALPILFAIFVYSQNPHFFDIMLNSDLGRMLLIWCVISEAIGAFMLNRLSRIEI